MRFGYLATGLCCLGLMFAEGTAGAAETDMNNETGLLCSVFVGKPTDHSVTMSVVNGEQPFEGQLCTREEGKATWACLPPVTGSDQPGEAEGRYETCSGRRLEAWDAVPF